MRKKEGFPRDLHGRGRVGVICQRNFTTGISSYVVSFHPRKIIEAVMRSDLDRGGDTVWHGPNIKTKYSDFFTPLWGRNKFKMEKVTR